MITHTVDITINRPVEEVFAFLTDPANHPRWDSTSLSMEQEEPGPWKTGMTFHEVRKIGRGTIDFRSRIADLEPNRGMDLQSLSGPPFQGHWRFSPAGPGTRLVWTGEMQLTGPTRLLEPLIGRSFRRTVTANFANLKRILEAAEPAGNPPKT